MENSQGNNEEVGEVRPTPPATKKNYYLFIVIILILTIAGLVAYILINANNKNKCLTDASTNIFQPTAEDKSEITDAKIIKILTIKANTILSFGSYAQTSKTLGFVSTKNEVDAKADYFKYYTNVPDSAKLRIILQQHKTTLLPSDGLTDRYKYENSDKQTISSEIQSLFGKNAVVSEATAAGGCPQITYDQVQDYYMLRSGCGGSPNPAVHFYQYKYEKEGDKAYVYIAAGAAAANQIMSDQLYYNLERTGDTKTIKLPSNYDDPTASAITGDNFKEFAHYRLVFENEDDNYAYQTIEKIKD